LVRQLDRILVIDEGRVVEDGSHDDLLARGGLYAELWNEQYGEIETA
jgi:ABC-type multidrug transport system fused ATPase/permease subunit